MHWVGNIFVRLEINSLLQSKQATLSRLCACALDPERSCIPHRI